MLKVLIADDEVNICLMIQKLIAWEKFNMQVIALVHNGIDALKVIEEQKPDVVISDIRMPGCDGLELVRKAKEIREDIEFIIISGYKQFEYAHTAINLGVKNYLLKPINQAELEDVLSKIAENKEIQVNRYSKEEELKNKASETIRQMRTHYISNIIDLDLSMSSSPIESSMLCFAKERVVAMFLKVDCEVKEEDISGKLQLIVEYLDKSFEQARAEYINVPVNSGVITIANVLAEEEGGVISSVNNVFHALHQMMSKFRGIHITTGVSQIKSDVSQTAVAITEAVNAVKCRGKLGTDRVICYSDIHFVEAPVDAYYEKTVFELGAMLESLDYDAAWQLMLSYLDKITAHDFYSPISVFSYLEKLEKYIVGQYAKLGIEEELLDELTTKLKLVLDTYCDCGEISYQFLSTVRDFMVKLIQERDNRNQKPIRNACAYIDAHFRENIGLEEVAEAIGMNTSYVSTLFKKEMGINYSDYLISCRIDAAKNLLKNTDMSMIEIAEEVGYNDSKYFSKIFNKVVGLKPSVYRKMYG